MRAAEARTQNGQITWQENHVEAEVTNKEEDSASQKDAIFMIVPILTMTFAMPAGLFLTGAGVIKSSFYRNTKTCKHNSEY